jgi:AcrR family transcriptional regulator
VGGADSRTAERKGKRGRAPFEPTDGQRATVREMAARGAEREAIAAAIGVSVPTLRKHFAAELADRMGSENLFTVADAEAPRQPAPARRKRAGAGGRKAWRPSDAERAKVRQWLALGMSPADVARRLGRTEPTVRRHFREEIATAQAVVEAELIDALMKSAKGGNVTAIRTALERLGQTKLAALEAELGKPAAPGRKEPKPEPIGKKMQAQLDARTAAQGTEWDGLLPEPTLQ